MRPLESVSSATVDASSAVARYAKAPLMVTPLLQFTYGNTDRPAVVHVVASGDDDVSCEVEPEYP